MNNQEILIEEILPRILCINNTLNTDKNSDTEIMNH